MSEAAEPSMVVSAVRDRALPRPSFRAMQAWIGSILIALFVLAPELAGSAYWSGVSKLATLYVVASVFMSVLYVDAGQTSFGQGAVFGAAAYAVAIACGLHGLPFWAGAPLGLFAALVVGALFALPALRVQWFYLGFVTLSAAMVLPELLIAANAYTNGINGISLRLPELTAPWPVGLTPLALLVAAVGVGALAIQAWLPTTTLGRRMRIAAVSPEAAQSLGVSPGLMRSTAFLVAALGTGCAGALYPATVGFVSPHAFGVDISILFFFALIVGGKGHPLGTLAGIGLLYLVPNVLLARFVEYRLLTYGCLALGVMLLMPGGILGAIDAWRRRFTPRGPAGIPEIDALLRSAGARNREQGAVTAEGPPREPAIVLEGVRKTFGRVVAVDGVDLEIRRGEIVGLIGANGSGKTSLLNVLSGFSRVDAGSVTIGGAATGGLPPHRVAKLGLGRSFQTPRMLPGSAWDNLAIGLEASLGGAGAAGPPGADAETLRRALERRDVATVPHGQRRLVEVARIMLTGADILLLDEPAAGLSPEERRTFSSLVRGLRDRMGKTIVLVEHDLDLVWSAADRIVVMEAGRVIASGSPAEVARHPAAAYLFVGSRHARC